MKCPNDETLLAMTERKGIEIDYCPTCRGVWLDRGELDKLIEQNPSASSSEFRNDPPKHERSHHPSYDTHGAYPYKKRKESFLGELFDF